MCGRAIYFPKLNEIGSPLQLLLHTKVVQGLHSLWSGIDARPRPQNPGQSEKKQKSLETAISRWSKRGRRTIRQNRLIGGCRAAALTPPSPYRGGGRRRLNVIPTYPGSFYMSSPNLPALRSCRISIFATEVRGGCLQ